MATAFGLALVLALAGCDSQPDPTAATPVAKIRKARASGPKGGDPDMVSAVSSGHAQGIVDLKFKLTKRPAVGEPVEIVLEMVPAVDLESLFARFQASDELKIVSGAETEHFEQAPAGVPVNHKLTVTAKTDGIFYVTAVVLADSATESVARNFSLPLIAGEGLQELPSAAPGATNVAASKPAPAQQ